MTNDLYTAVVTATPGSARSDDGALSLDVNEPKTLDGPGEGTNPEQLMAAALGSCLLDSLRIAATSTGGSTEGAQVETRVTLANDEPGYTARYALRVTLPDAGTDASAVLEQALSICPFTKTLDASALDVQLA
ncbi:OsmC family protein [Paenibacillus sp. TRM 82003]|uniref:OsmC family protein n=1 Tax=Kineococcus sp. TRM81007 TaxID=2925831 RepID=UPI001F57196E|nr:OsmC family protein [Kineococcus sp. TRM81007]MCI2236995.1 OsmC family protein [Kineococcus sp. TRM81007]MCI3926610.1 OsmC family protein [Paenibacillus sp. TRM 82003]